MKFGARSILWGFSVSVVLAVSGIVVALSVPRVFLYVWVPFLLVGMPLGILIKRVLPVPALFLLPPKAGVLFPDLLAAPLTWGLFLSSVVYLRLRSREAGRSRPLPNSPVEEHAQRTSWLSLRTVVTIALCVGAIFAGVGSVLNEYRASSGCGPGYSWPFQPIKAVVEAAILVSPVVMIAAVYQWLRPGRVVSAITLLLGIVYGGASAYICITDTLQGYAPCDRKGDESSLALFAVGILVLLAWLAVCGVAAIIDSVRRRP